jgi:hypothetical protein
MRYAALFLVALCACATPPAVPPVEVAAPASNSHFEQLEVVYQAWDDIEIVGNREAQEIALEAKIDGAVRLHARYTEFAAHAKPPWDLAARYRGATIQHRFAVALRHAENPFQDDTEGFYLHRDKLIELAIPMEDAARREYRKIAAEDGGPWSAKARDGLRELDLLLLEAEN